MMGHSSDAEEYSYPPLPPRSIRVLKLDHSTPYLSGTLEVVSLDDQPDFDAVSYAWGDSTTPNKFVCFTRNKPTVDEGVSSLLGNETFESMGKICVRQNLLDALLEFKRRNHRHGLWVDALCIDQNDDNYKSHQIADMGLVYSSAVSVIIWLGFATDRQMEAMQLIPTFIDRLRQHKSRGRSLVSYLECIGFPGPQDEFWLHFRRFFFRVRTGEGYGPSRKWSSPGN